MWLSINRQHWICSPPERSTETIVIFNRVDKDEGQAANKQTTLQRDGLKFRNWEAIIFNCVWKCVMSAKSGDEIQIKLL